MLALKTRLTVVRYLILQMMITHKGLVAIVMTQTDTCVAPHGGAERFLGTNPIAFGFPVENSHPMNC